MDIRTEVAKPNCQKIIAMLFDLGYPVVEILEWSSGVELLVHTGISHETGRPIKTEARTLFTALSSAYSIATARVRHSSVEAHQ